VAISPSPRLESLDAACIGEAALPLGLGLSTSQSQTMARYVALLLRWNTVHNLTAIQSSADVLTHHLLDSLAVLPHLQRLNGPRPVKVLDVGSGGGLPGVPLAIAAPNWHVTLVDKVQKKVAFLMQAKLELLLANVECVHANVEDLRPLSLFHVVVARAFATLSEFVRATRHLIAPGGWWFAMKGVRPDAELDALQVSASDVQVLETIRLRVPGLAAQRHLIVMQLRPLSG